MLPRCRRCHALLLGPQDFLGALFPIILFVALVSTAYAYIIQDLGLLIIGSMVISQVLLMIGATFVLSRAMGVRVGLAGYHPACFELCRLDEECATTEARRAEVEKKRERHELQLARLLGREPELMGKFCARPGAGLGVDEEMAALDGRMDILARYHRRLDIIEAAMASGNTEQAADQYEAMGLMERAKALRIGKTDDIRPGRSEKVIGPALTGQGRRS